MRECLSYAWYPRYTWYQRYRLIRLYHERMEHMGVRELRDQLGRRVDEAYFRGEHTVIEKSGEPRAVLVPYSWWHEQQEDRTK